MNIQKFAGVFGTSFIIFTSLFVFVALPEDAAAQSESRRYSSSVQRKINALDDDKVEDLTIPILFGVTVNNLSDSWGDARSSGRSHEGIDIMAPRGAFISAPTEGVVTSVGYGTNGGNYVYVAIPGKERLYFAHLDTVWEGIKSGAVLEKGDIIGTVGNTGNASGGAPHLHLGIYTGRGAINPYPRLTKEFTQKERIEVLTELIQDLLEKLKDLED